VSTASVNNMFTLYYQPKIDMQTKKTHAAEALIRLTRNGELISPNHFIPQAEKDGSIIEIDKWVLRRIPDDARKIFTKTFEEEIRISFNISASYFDKDGFYEDVISTLNHTKDFHSLFEIEITESALIGNKQNAIDTINRLREDGLRFALDDFGTGYASLKLFKELPLDTIKIDKLFVDGMVGDKKTNAIVDSIMYLAKKLDMKTVAEGVEQVEQVEQLANMNCDEIQGYFYSKPLRLDDFILFVNSVNNPPKKNRFIYWSNEYSSGLFAFDSHHIILINLMNTLYDVLQDENLRKESKTWKYIEIVGNFVSVHFESEEKYMVKYNYPKTKEHIMEHRKFVDDFQNLKSSLIARDERNFFILFDMLKEWFIQHELKADKELVHYVKNKF